MHIIDLTEDLTPKNRTLMTKDLGESLRSKYNLDVFDHGKEEVTVVIPHYVFEIGLTFFDAMFGMSMMHLRGPKGFNNLYKFEFESGKNLMGNLPETYWELIHARKKNVDFTGII